MNRPAQKRSRPIIKMVIGFAMRLFQKRKKVPLELQQAINACKNLDDLLALLFSIDYVKDEAMIAAFDKRIDQLEKADNVFLP